MWQDRPRDHPVHLQRVRPEVRAYGWWEVQQLRGAVLPFAPDVAMASRGTDLSRLCGFVGSSTSPETPVQARQRSLTTVEARATIPPRNHGKE